MGTVGGVQLKWPGRGQASGFLKGTDKKKKKREKTSSAGKNTGNETRKEAFLGVL